MDKSTLRRRMRDLGPVAPEQAAKVVSHLFDWLSAHLPGTAAAYLAMSDEVPVHELFGRLPGWRWVLPRVEEDGSLTLRDRELPREAHRWGMEQPVDSGSPVPLHEVDVILVPGLAFDRTGARLGRGKGYYDGLLGRLRSDCVSVGVTTTARLVDSVPIEGHDVHVDYLATEDGVTDRRARPESDPVR